jgi:hypothetical protein
MTTVEEKRSPRTQQRLKNAENEESIIENIETSREEERNLIPLKIPSRRLHVTGVMRENEKLSFGSPLDHVVREILHEKMNELHRNLNSNVQCHLVKMKMLDPGGYNWLSLSRKRKTSNPRASSRNLELYHSQKIPTLSEKVLHLLRMLVRKVFRPMPGGPKSVVPSSTRKH